MLAIVVSDGAGSAAEAETGAKLVCMAFLRELRQFVRSGSDLIALTDETVFEWLDQIRERINAVATRKGHKPRDYAATLVAVLADHQETVVVHVGDGAAVVRMEGVADWLVPSWPFHGEYASMTTFVTDDPQPQCKIARLGGRAERIAVFSDGLERLVLDHSSKVAHGPFFDRMTSPLVASVATGEDRSLSYALRSYLDGDAVCERTDDDKSLVLGLRL